MTRKIYGPAGKFNRRSLLKGAAAGGAVVATGAIGGFPTVWAQNIKDITLVVAGGSYAVIKEIGNQAAKDLGFNLTMQAVTDDVQINRSITQPNTIDINNIDGTKMPYLVGKGVLRPVPVSKYKQWADTVPLFTKNAYPTGQSASNQGLSPFKCMYYADKDGTKLANKPTDWMTGIPMVYNADTLGIRPDLMAAAQDHEWKELLNPEFKGKAALVDVSRDRHHGRGDGARIPWRPEVRQQGQHDQAEIDKTIEIMIGFKKSGHFRAFWTNFDQSVNLMASGEVVIQSMWSPAVTAVRSRNIDCYYAPLKEGYRGWLSLLSPMAHLSGLKLDAAMEYINWYNSGWQGGFIAKQGYYSAVPETAKKFMTPTSGPTGTRASRPRPTSWTRTALMEKKGVTRDGGAYLGPDGQYRLLEHGDGRGQIPDQALERVRRA